MTFLPATTRNDRRDLILLGLAPGRLALGLLAQALDHLRADRVDELL